MDAFYGNVSRAQAHREDGGYAHVKVGCEGIEDLVGAHMGVGVDDTLAAALHDDECEGEGGVVECALPLRPMLAGVHLGERFSRLDRLRLRRAAGGARPFALPRRPPHHQRSRLLAGPEGDVTPAVEPSFDQRPID